MTVATLGANDIVGEMAILGDVPRNASVRAKGRMVLMRPSSIVTVSAAPRAQRGPLICAHASACDGDADEYRGLTVSAIHRAARLITPKECVRC